jgi:hypothetical protein
VNTTSPLPSNDIVPLLAFETEAKLSMSPSKSTSLASSEAALIVAGVSSPAVTLSLLAAGALLRPSR